MAEKKIIGSVKVQCEAGKANPAPPIGPALGPYGINIMQFCKEFNEKTASQPGMIIPAVITIFIRTAFTKKTDIFAMRSTTSITAWSITSDMSREN